MTSMKMNEQSHLSLESKCDDDETWHDPLAKSKICQASLFVNKLESSFSVPINHHNKVPKGDDTNDENQSYQPKLKPPSFRRSWKPKLNETGIKLLRVQDDGDALKQVQNQCHLSDHRNVIGNIGQPKPNQGITLPKLPDMALLKRLNTERQRATKGSLETAQRVIRRVPRKLRRTIHQSTRIHGVTIEQKPPKDECEGKAPEPETKAPQTSRWKDFYVGSVPLPSALGSKAMLSEAPTRIIGQPPAKTETEDSISMPAVSEKKGNISRFSQRLQTAGAEFNQIPNTDERCQIQTDLPSLLEKSYSYSPVGLRRYEPSSSYNETASFLNHLQFMLDGKASPTADITQASQANFGETALKNTDSAEVRHEIETSENPLTDLTSRVRSRPRKIASAGRSLGNEPQTSESYAPGGLLKTLYGPRRQENSDSTCKVETGKNKPSIMRLFRHTVVVTSTKFKGGRLVLAIFWAMIILQIGSNWKFFFENRRSASAPNSKSSGNSIPILKEHFYLEAASNRDSAHDGSFDNNASNRTVFGRRLKAVMTPIEDLHQNIIQPIDHFDGEALISNSSPLVVSRTAMRDFGYSKNQELPILHHQRENFATKNVLRSLIKPVAIIFHSGKKILRSAAAAVLLALD